MRGRGDMAEEVGDFVEETERKVIEGVKDVVK